MKANQFIFFTYGYSGLERFAWLDWNPAAYPAKASLQRLLHRLCATKPQSTQARKKCVANVRKKCVANVSKAVGWDECSGHRVTKSTFSLQRL